MKYLLTYWVIGCTLVVPATLSIESKCQDYRVSPPYILTTIAIWPGVVVAGLLASPLNIHPLSCDGTRL